MKPKLTLLPNKIPFIEIPMVGATSVTLFVFCRVGSRYESKAINGASHFIEHLMFKGTKRRPNTETLSRELDRYGAVYNAMTSKDYTCYFVKIDAKKGKEAADILQDMVFHSKFDPKELERERGVIIEEINMYEDNPHMHIEDLLEEVLFPNSTLGWNIAGPREVIRSVSREALVSYRDAYYVPGRLVVAAAGAIRPDVRKKVRETFGRVRVPKAKRDVAFKKFSNVMITKRLAYEEKKTEQTQVGIAFHGFAMSHADEPAAKILATILGGSMSSRLFINVRERKGLCYAISASHQSLEDTGIFAVYAGLDRKRLPLAIRTIIRELKLTASKGVTGEELRRAKDYLRGKLALAFEDTSVRADWYGREYLFRKSLETPEQRIAALDAVSAGDVKRVAKAIFRDDHMASAVIGPRVKTGTLEKIFRMR
jgi:predicted Zn-dependent peptidase